jgi:translation initiation factor 5A
MKTTTEIKQLKKGRYIIIDDAPCKVVNISVSAPGKHGHAKVRLEAIGIFDNQKRVIVKPAHATVEVPTIDKRVGTIISVSRETVQVLDPVSYETIEIEIPSDFKDELVTGTEISYWIVLGRYLLKPK